MIISRSLEVFFDFSFFLFAFFFSFLLYQYYFFPTITLTNTRSATTGSLCLPFTFSTKQAIFDVRTCMVGSDECAETGIFRSSKTFPIMKRLERNFCREV